MSAFEYLFTFFGLLLGLAAANVATGFADMWRDRRQTTVGICTPILALCVLLGAMNLWLRFWNSRDAMTLDAWHLIWVTCLALPYVFLSRGMFSGAGGATSLEAHYLAHRRVMLAALAAPALVSLVQTVLSHGEVPLNWNTIWMGLRVVTPLLLIPFASATVQRIGLAGIASLLVLGLFR